MSVHPFRVKGIYDESNFVVCLSFYHKNLPNRTSRWKDSKATISIESENDILSVEHNVRMT